MPSENMHLDAAWPVCLQLLQNSTVPLTGYVARRTLRAQSFSG